MDGNIYIPVRLRAYWMSSAALEVEAASTCRSLVELPITAFGNRHEPATTQPVITQMIP